MTAWYAGGEPVACRTRDVSLTGLCLDAAAPAETGRGIEISVLDADSGEVIQVSGLVVRRLEATATTPPGVGVRIDDPPAAWQALIARLAAANPGAPARAVRRLRILVVGDEARRRGALALYVTSGWDVRFASDLEGTREALRGRRIDAVIAEHDLEDERWRDILEAARTTQETARRIVRSRLAGRLAPPPGGRGDLVHRVVDMDAGLDALLDALTADWGEDRAAHGGS